MDWNDVKNMVGKAAPMVGTLLGGPAGGAVGSMVSNVLGVEDSPEAIVRELKNNPDALVKIKTLESEERTALRRLTVEAEQHRLAADTSRIQTVNATMQSEAKSEHWPQWSWRPYNGFLYGTTIFCVYFVLPLADIAVPSVPFEIWAGWGSILGVAAWHRGAQKRTQSGEKTLGSALAEKLSNKKQGG